MTSSLLGVRNQTIWAPFKNNLQIGAGSITMNKASGGEGIPAELFQILKDDALKVALNMPVNLVKLSSDHRIAKGQVSFQSLRKAMPKNAQTTA